MGVAGGDGGAVLGEKASVSQGSGAGGFVGEADEVGHWVIL